MRIDESKKKDRPRFHYLGGQPSNLMDILALFNIAYPITFFNGGNES